MPCSCRCHAYGPGSNVSCDPEHDKGSSGVPGLASCSPCDGSYQPDRPRESRSSAESGSGPMSPMSAHPERPASACINRCVSKAVDGSEPVPNLATHGRLCAGCFNRLRGWLEDIPVDYALLPLTLSAGGSQRYDGTTRSKQPEAPAPLRLDTAALTDSGRDQRLWLRGEDAAAARRAAASTAVRPPGDERWSEGAPDVPDVLAILHSWAEQLRCDLDPSRVAS